MKVSAQDLINQVGKKPKIVRQLPRLNIKRGIPLAVLKTMTTGQIKRLQKQMKGGNK